MRPCSGSAMDWGCSPAHALCKRSPLLTAPLVWLTTPLRCMCRRQCCKGALGEALSSIGAASHHSEEETGGRRARSSRGRQGYRQEKRQRRRYAWQRADAAGASQQEEAEGAASQQGPAACGSYIRCRGTVGRKACSQKPTAAQAEAAAQGRAQQPAARC